MATEDTLCEAAKDEENLQQIPLNPDMFRGASLSFALGSAVSSSGAGKKLSFQAPRTVPLRPAAKPHGRSTVSAQAKTLSPPELKPLQPVIPAVPKTPARNPNPSGDGLGQARVSLSKFVSAFPDFHQLRHGGPEPAEPANAAALRKAAIVWFRNDLRLHDNEAFSTATKESLSVLPVYCFDVRDFGKSSYGFDKTGPSRANFLLQSVADLRTSLRDRGSDLIVRIGKPEEVLVDLAKKVGADALYAHQEVTNVETNAEKKIVAALEEEGVEAKLFWGSTLYHIEDLPFKLQDMPSNYGCFKDKVQTLKVRDALEAPKRLKKMPIRGNVQPGDLPTLQDLGCNPQVSQNGRGPSNTLVGGESVAMQKIKTFATECRKQIDKLGKDKTATGNTLYGATFSCQISPWLAMGCLSPRYLFEELKEKRRSIFASVKTGSEDSNANWLVFELLWRDFFRFITKKYTTIREESNGIPTMACSGAVAA